MEFFNDLSKRFTSVAKTVSEKTKDSVEVTRIANDLRVQKNTLEQLYTELGKVCYAVRMGEAEADQAEALAERVRQTRDRIDELTAQRDAIRDIRRCPGCGAVMTKDARFCSSCGRKLPEDAPAAEPMDKAEYCPDCGAERVGDERYCAVCGKSFAEEAGEAPAAEAAEAPEVPLNVEEPEATDEEAGE